MEQCLPERVISVVSRSLYLYNLTPSDGGQPVSVTWSKYRVQTAGNSQLTAEILVNKYILLTRNI